MSRITRSRRVVKTETESRANEKVSSAAKVIKEKDNKSRAKVGKALDQNENAVPSGKTQKGSNKQTANNHILSDLRPSVPKEDVPAVEKCTHFGLKSPVLRDRTNKSDEPVQFGFSPKKSAQPEPQREQIPVLPNQDKKFFKFKSDEVTRAPAIVSKKTVRCLPKGKKAPIKKRAPSDSTFSYIADDQTESAKLPEKSLRPRAAKNYCELSKLSHSSNVGKSPERKDQSPNGHSKDVPIYKTLKLSQEKIEDKEEIYDFPDDSQEKDPSSKKKKKTIKKPRVKRAKKTDTAPRPPVKRVVKKIPKRNTNVADRNDQNGANNPEEAAINFVEKDLVSPDGLVDAGNSTIGEAPTLKIVSDEKLPEDRKFSLSNTLSNQKTLTTEHKLDDSKDSGRSSQSIANDAANDQCPNDMDHCPSDNLDMVDHSLIRKSMSPITKLVQNFDARSPWRPTGTFSCVRELVQSTPQIHKPSSLTNKRAPIEEVQDGNRRSIFSEDTIQAPMLGRDQTPLSPLGMRNEDLSMNVGSSSVKCSSPNLRQTNLDGFLDLVEKPESTHISTAHGIFDDVSSTPINRKKMRRISEEANVENAFGFDDCDLSNIAVMEKHSSTPKIATETDVKESKKGKVFVNARVKSSVPSRISTNTVKRTLLHNVMKKNFKQNMENLKINEKNNHLEDAIENDDEDELDDKENDVAPRDNDNNHRFPDPKKAVIDSISFSDTFDLLSDKEEDLKSRVPEEVPLFVDLEPVHFSKPPRRSYNKRKRAVCFESINKSFESDDEDDEPRKPKKKKESKHVKEGKKQMQEWVKTINKTFEEVENFDLVVE